MFRNDRNLFKRLIVRFKAWLTLGSVGITPRLALAFALVALLAATTNLIVQKGVSLLERQRRAEQERSANDLRQISTLRESVGLAKQAVSSTELQMALSQFDRAVEERAQVDSPETTIRHARALANLDRELAQFLESTGQPASEPLARLIAAHEKSGDALIQFARNHRALRARYQSVLAGMDTRVRQAAENSWKILGRVVARQQLVDLRAKLDELRIAHATPGVFEPGSQATAALTLAESALSDSLRRDEAALRQEQGALWFDSMSADLASLTAMRSRLMQNEPRRATNIDGYVREARRLATLLPAARDPSLDAARDDAIHAGSSTETFVPEPPSRSLVAWLSAAVLALLLYICFVTIFSIVRPVRRLIAASTRIARGGNARVVADGSIRELESLAEAFNSMAGQLAIARQAAREAQQMLEAKVEERTRQLQELAEQDPLTGVANRRQLFVELNQALETARFSRERVGVFFLDIDNFKTLNDSMGHLYGDRVLVAIARRLEIIAHACGFAARLGGDEFTIVHRGAADNDQIMAFGSSIVRAFDSPLEVDDREVIVSVSVGVSVFPDHEQQAEALLRAADAALFRAKALGRSQLAVFTPELLTTASAKFAIEQKLRRAIQNGEFELFYQPLVNVQTLQVTVVEALLRWRSPEGRHLSPGEFLAVAEESGLIVEISDWVLRTAIRTAAEWHRGAWPEARVAINVSPRQFLDYRFVSTLEELLHEYQLPARCVELELTESVLQTGPHTVKSLDQLRALGVAVALDDFGTGYSSLASLQQLPLTRVKLDRSLIAEVDDSARAASIVRATIALCRGLGLEVTAEGVERIEQFAALLPYRTLDLQGYLFARPVSATDLLPLLKSLPEHCDQLAQQTRKLPLQANPARRSGENRSSVIALLRD